MLDFIRGLLESNFMPHGHCYLWKPEILWLHAISDGAIALAYYAIPFFLIYIVRRRRDLVFPWIFVMFGAFILLCGTTHVLEIWSIWNGAYRFTGVVKAITGVVSIATAIALVPVVPRVLALASPEQLRAANTSLQAQITAREQAEQALRELNQDLEARVAARTAELERANDDLRRQIAEREQAEQALRELNQSLESRVAERTVEITHANARLEERNRELQEFAYVASHDLQEPLRKITTFADLLVADHGAALSEDGHLYLDRIRDAAHRMSRLIRDLLAYSRISTQAQSFQTVDLNEIVAAVRSDLEIQIEEADGRVEVEPLPTVEADPTQMRQLFQNLIGNGIKFRRPQISPVVRITAELQPGDAPEPGATRTYRIDVTDNGIGFEEKYASEIFLPFRRLHGRSEYPGTGVGLAIVQRIARRHGGEVEVRSRPGEGTTFSIVLPASPPASLPTSPT